MILRKIKFSSLLKPTKSIPGEIAVLTMLIICFSFSFSFQKQVVEYHSGSIDSLKFIIEKNPTPEAYFELGMIYLSRSEFDAAHEKFLRCIRTNPNSSFALRALAKIGIIFYRRNQFEEAEKELNKVLSSQPNQKEARLFLQLIRFMIDGTLAFNQNSLELAEDTFQKVLSSDSLNTTAKNYLKATQERRKAQNYIEKTKNALEYADLQNAQSYLAQAESLWSAHPDISSLHQLINAQKTTITEDLSQGNQKQIPDESIPEPTVRIADTEKKSRIQSTSTDSTDSIQLYQSRPTETSDKSFSIKNLISNIHFNLKTVAILLCLLSVLVLAGIRFHLMKKKLNPTSPRNISTPEVPAISDSTSGFISRIGKYEIIEELERGGMGNVVKARHPHFRKPVVIKSILPELKNEPQIRQRLLREANILFELDHPNIVRVTDLVEENEQIYIVLQYVEGKNLKQIVGNSKPLEPIQAIRLFIQACNALSYLHQRGMIHRDIKPQNLMLENKTGILKLVDFGIVKPQDSVVNATLTSASRIVGTPNYMSPEQLLNDEIDHRTDIFSLGITLFEVVTATHPFGTQDSSVIKAILNKPPLPMKRLNTPLNELEKICNRMLEKDPMDRYQTADAVCVALTKLLI